MLISGSDETLKSFPQLSRSSLAWRYLGSALKELTASSATAEKVLLSREFSTEFPHVSYVMKTSKANH